jgi:hypothetical protein
VIDSIITAKIIQPINEQTAERKLRIHIFRITKFAKLHISQFHITQEALISMGETRGLLRAAELCAQEFTVSAADAAGNPISEKIWVRTLTDTELREIQRELANFSKETRALYADGQPLAEVMMAELDESENENLAIFAITTEVRGLKQNAEKKFPVPLPLDESQYKDDAKLEKAREDYEKRVQDHAQQVDDEFDRAFDARLAELAARPHAELLELALPVVRRRAIAQYNNGIDTDYRIYYSVYTDDRKERYFASIEEVISLPQQIKKQLLDLTMMVDVIQPIDIKNSQGKFVAGTGLAANTQEAIKVFSTTDSQESGSPKKSSRGGRKRSSTE